LENAGAKARAIPNLGRTRTGEPGKVSKASANFNGHQVGVFAEVLKKPLSAFGVSYK